MKTVKTAMDNVKNLMFLALLFMGLQAFATIEDPLKPENPNDDGKGKIVGTIVDKNSDSPMEFANIAVYTKADSILVTGGITNENGQFEITDITYGDYYLEANFIGFDKTNVVDITLDRSNRVYDAGSINLSPSTVALGEVNVVADKAAVEYKLDKKVVNVSQVISAIGGTAVDVLENTPSVQVDIEGNVSLRGSGNFTVLIDGRPSVLSGSDALRQIPSSAIENIEIITNPSAKYEPDGAAGIINLVMKKNSMNGLNGIVNASVGTGEKYRGDFMLNYRMDKVNLFIGADWTDEINNGGMSATRETYSNDTTEFLNMKGDRNWIRGGHRFKGGADIYLSDVTTLTLSGETGTSERGNEGGGRTENYTVPASEDIFSITEETSDRNNDFYTLNMNFQHKFDDKGHRIEATAFYSDESGTDNEIEGELLADGNYYPTSEYLSRVSTFETEDERDIRLKLDYTYPFSEDGKFEAGYQGRLESEDETLEFRDYDQASDSWIINNEYSSSTDFQRDIHAVYSTYSNKLGKVAYMAGLRGELTIREIKNSKATDVSTLNRFDLFPTTHFSYPIMKTADLTASYSRRINRPNGRDLDPTPNYFNRYAIRFGNPDLKPEYTNSYELGFMKRFGETRSFMSADLFRRVTNNKIDRTQELGEDGVIYMYTDNFDKDYSTGVEVTANLSYKKWLTVNTSVNVYDYKITGEIDGESIDQQSTNWGGRMNTTFKISQSSRFQVNAFFRGKSVSAQGESGAMFFTNFSYRQEFLDNKLSATVSFRDPFGTGRFERTSYGDDFKSWFRFEREPRVVMLTLSYKLNNFKEDRRGNRGGGDGGMDMDGGEF
ncbi:outer membrane beta-barrel family protein [Draconibacterium sp. IB214405]|uniref:outer membrane beta-barrel family protein n=1 Tax=Draconibacterium sp. IB214405 TaxID=3097352 RepID=UPI002A0C5F6F|nr:outer membrane beta-barrel family protein [Draconibacterium sp. IB214405]MDX8338093.1 outer membrane beta-barrel family protein [Draconibacterium sp. IB214405]